MRCAKALNSLIDSQDNAILSVLKWIDTKWLWLVSGLKVVSGLDEAIEHIWLPSTGHSDDILIQLVLRAGVELFTQRLHACGPIELRESTTGK
jgi:gamma-glutamyl phosphate reductase